MNMTNKRIHSHLSSAAVLLVACSPCLLHATNYDNPGGGSCTTCEDDAQNNGQSDQSAPQTKSFDWSMNIGFAVLAKPEDFTGVANANQHKTGQLKNLGSELNRYFQGINRQDPRKIFIQKALIDASCFHPSCIELDDGGTVEVLKKPATGGFPEYIHQILSDDIFTQIDLLVAPESGFRIRTWQRTWATLNKVSGFYDSTGIATFTPISDITFKRPTGSTGNNTLLYINKETTGVSGSNVTTKEFVQTLDGNGKPDSVVQKMYEGEGTGGTLLMEETVIFSERGSKLWDYSIVRERKEASLNGQTGAVGSLVLVS